MFRSGGKVVSFVLTFEIGEWREQSRPQGTGSLGSLHLRKDGHSIDLGDHQEGGAGVQLSTRFKLVANRFLTSMLLELKGRGYHSFRR